MAQNLGIDYSVARPGGAAIKAAGYNSVGRYIGLGSGSKLLSASERDDLHKAGLGIFLVGESLSNRALAGRAAGVADAQAVLQAANALGVPATVPLFAAVDFDASWAQVKDYLLGWQSVLGKRAGEYGPWDVINGSPLDYHWQAGASTAWSHGRNAKLHPKAHLYQRRAATVPHPLASTDEDVVCRPIPMWDSAKPPMHTVHKPTRVTKARRLLTQSIDLLNAAVAHGRTGTVKKFRDALRLDRKKGPRF